VPGLVVLSPLRCWQVSLSPLHPAHVIFRNLVIGSCSLSEYETKRRDTLSNISNTEATIELLGGLVSEPVSNELLAGGNTSEAPDEGTCASADEASDTCPQRYLRDFLSALADDPEASVKTWGGATELPLALNQSAQQLATEFCASHEIFSDIPPLVQRLGSLKMEEGELVAVGCPCDISAMYPNGGVETGGFNVTLTIQGLDTSRPKATALACLFNSNVEVEAHILSTDTVMCTVPSLAHLAAAAATASSPAPAPVAAHFNSEGPGEVERVAVDLVGAAFRISRSTNQAKWLRYYTAPTFEFPPTPGALITGSTPRSQRTVTIRGTNFNANVGGMYLRVSNLNASAAAARLSEARARLTVVDTTMAIVELPPILTAGTFRFELSVNSDTWHHPGDIEFVDALDILSLTPSRGAVRGGYTVTVTHTRAPFPVSIGSLEAKVGQYYVALTRVSATEMTLRMPRHTLDGDPSWHVPGNVSVQIYILVALPDAADHSSGAPERLQISRMGSGGARFAYECSSDEIRAKDCCPPGTAGPGGNNGSFCFACQVRKRAPYHP
jgi:hypothetical protein